MGKSLQKKLQRLPTAKYRERAEKIVLSILSGDDWRDYQGKRLKHDRDIVSVPLGQNWRLIFTIDDEGDVFFKKAMSHSEYNATKPG